MQGHLGETELTKEPTWRDYIVDGCGEFAVQLALLVFCFLVGNVYLAYVAFGVGALFLILPFAMLIYYAARKYVEKQRMNDSNHVPNAK